MLTEKGRATYEKIFDRKISGDEIQKVTNRLIEESKKPVDDDYSDIVKDDMDGVSVVGGSGDLVRSAGPDKYDPEPDLRDPDGNKITLSAHQRNAIYKQAKDLEGKIRENLCSTNECDNPTEDNIKRMQNEFDTAQLREQHRKCMQALGADPTDFSYESMRPTGRTIAVKYFGGLDFDEKGEIING